MTAFLIYSKLLGRLGAAGAYVFRPNSAMRGSLARCYGDVPPNTVPHRSLSVHSASTSMRSTCAVSGASLTGPVTHRPPLAGRPGGQCEGRGPFAQALA